MKIDYRPEKDGLRAIAVISVILFHLQININGYQLFRGGYIGVDIFFVISGFVVTQSLLALKCKSPEAFISKFYEKRIKRIKRIVPALIICIVSTLF